MKSWPWDSIITAWGENGFPIYDRDYTAEEMRMVLRKIFSNGVFMDDDNAFATLAADGMNVIVKPGYCNIEGGIGWEESERMLEITAASSQDRIDTVVLRWDNTLDERKIDLYVVQGVAAAIPARPNLTRTDLIYEIGIADIFIPKNTTSISAERITDTRLENARCGAVVPFVAFDTTSFQEQLEAAFAEMSKELKEQTDKAVDLAKDALDDTVAGNLQNQIDEVKEEVATTCPFPPGSVLQMVADTDPNEIWNGTEWEKMEDVFLIAASEKHPLGETGGEEAHKLTVAEIPAHSHRTDLVAVADASSGGTADKTAGLNTGAGSYMGAPIIRWSPASGRSYQVTTNTGSSGEHNNMPPYEAVNTWKRVDGLYPTIIL